MDFSKRQRCWRRLEMDPGSRTGFWLSCAATAFAERSCSVIRKKLERIHDFESFEPSRRLYHA